jgi:UDPglucose--hexose-1-phosphate uridylyltransferase
VRSPGTQADTPGWKVRVIPNKYPALENRTGVINQDDRLFGRMAGIGAHEVVIETPRHDAELSRLAVVQVRRVLTAYRERLNALYTDPRMLYVTIFKNQGRAAGASLIHSHSQVIATPLLPHNVKRKLTNSAEYRERHNRCLHCELLERELDTGTRIVEKTERFVALTPFASRFPFEAKIVPLKHDSDFGKIPQVGLQELAGLLKSLLQRITACLPAPVPYNLNLSTSPNPRAAASPFSVRRDLEDFVHWHLEITPRMTKIAGFETGSGFYINQILPEDAARLLREAEPHI